MALYRILPYRTVPYRTLAYCRVACRTAPYRTVQRPYGAERNCTFAVCVCTFFIFTWDWKMCFECWRSAYCLLPIAYLLPTCICLPRARGRARAHACLFPCARPFEPPRPFCSPPWPQAPLWWPTTPQPPHMEPWKGNGPGP